jgi:cytochrome P450
LAETFVAYDGAVDDWLTPLSAVTAAHPYDYYERLTRERPFGFDAGAGVWVAAGCRPVEEALSHPALRVRPPSEPVPKAMFGTALGDVFARLARMNDGPRHDVLRACVRDALDRWHSPSVGVTALRCARQLAAAIRSAGELNGYLHDVPAFTIATMIGAPDCELADVRDFARAIAAGATSEEIERGIAATGRLRAFIAPRLDDDRSANALGLLFQSYDATAGLIGNALAALISDPSLRSAADDDASLDAHLAAIERYDPPVHNTRRFAAAAVRIAGTPISPGDGVLVAMAAANRDPLARQSYTFGFGPHACPGARVARTIAKAGVTALLESTFDLSHAAVNGYRPSFNLRIPTFWHSFGTVAREGTTPAAW